MADLNPSDSTESVVANTADSGAVGSAIAAFAVDVAFRFHRRLPEYRMRLPSLLAGFQ